ncbi:hypothetical protein Tco_0318701 [Tanacetum coccineum]
MEESDSGLKPKEKTFQVVLSGCTVHNTTMLSLHFRLQHLQMSRIFPRVPGHDFDAAFLLEEDTNIFLRDPLVILGGLSHSLNDVVIDQMHQPWRTFCCYKSTEA